MICRLTLKLNVNEEAQVSWQSGKVAVKAEIYWRAEGSASLDRKGEVNFNFEYRNGGARNILNVRALVLKSPLIGNGQRDLMVCLKADSTFQSAPSSDPIDISGYAQPPSASGSVEYVQGEVSSGSSNQCPTDQFRFKVGLKASAGHWVLDRRDGGSYAAAASGRISSRPTYYAECDAEKKDARQIWAAGLVPQTDACYKAALDFTTLTAYQVDLRFAALPAPVERAAERLAGLLTMGLLPYWFAGPDAFTSPSVHPSSGKDVGHLQLNVTFLPSEVEDEGYDGEAGMRMTNVEWSVNSNRPEKYDGVTVPAAMFPLPSTSIPRTARLAYEHDTIRKIKSLHSAGYKNKLFTLFRSVLFGDVAVHPHHG